MGVKKDALLRRANIKKKLQELRSSVINYFTDLSSTADIKRYGFFDRGSAFDTFLHDQCTAFTGNHVKARLEED